MSEWDIPIARTMTFDSRIEWVEVMCDLMCGGVEEDTDEEDDSELVCDTEGEEY